MQNQIFRPFKNTDNKAITGTNVAQFSQAVSHHASPIQRGFVAGRQLVLNIVDLDAIARAQANYNHFNNESILVLWDFMAAFPSLRHQLISIVFRHYGFPRGFINFLELCYLCG